ncbi:hypothetical protein AB0I53_42435 [Saccharopolyspora sp. NPDC050389]|uniref:hypothetical protein n=1 Tax=Saccharopolyspora sp. NPDC050389 TaxID=3155516 RepID=UPI0033CE076A
MRQENLGALIGAAFGAVFVFVNTSDPLPGPVVLVLKVLAAVALAAIVVLAVLANKSPRAADARPAGGMFGKRYGLVVAAEAVLLVGGVAVLRMLGAPDQANVAWIAFVVGVHFLALAGVWRQSSIAVPGVLLTVFGIAGLAMAGFGALAWVPLVSGTLSGITLLAGSLTATARGFARSRGQGA